MKKGDLKVLVIAYIVLMTVLFGMVKGVNLLENNNADKQQITMNE